MVLWLFFKGPYLLSTHTETFMDEIKRHLGFDLK